MTTFEKEEYYYQWKKYFDDLVYQQVPFDLAQRKADEYLNILKSKKEEINNG